MDRLSIPPPLRLLLYKKKKNGCMLVQGMWELRCTLCVLFFHPPPDNGSIKMCLETFVLLLCCSLIFLWFDNITVTLFCMYNTCLNIFQTTEKSPTINIEQMHLFPLG